MKFTPCGGCGNDDPEKRCLGCLHPFVEAVATPNPTRFYVNFTDVTGKNTDWVEVTEQAFVTLSSKRNVLFTQRGFAIYTGRGGMLHPEHLPTSDGPAEWLQFVDVPAVALIPSDPLNPELLTVLNMADEPTPVPEPVGWVPVSSDGETYWNEFVRHGQKHQLAGWERDGYTLKPLYE